MNLTEMNNQKNKNLLHGEHILLRLTYISCYNNHNENNELQKILAQAQHNNSPKGITGVLAFNHNYFLQGIEGSRPVINELLRKLIKDPRHFSLQVIEAREIDERSWGQWSMNYLSPSSKNKDVMLKYSGGASFNPYLMNTRQIHGLLAELSQLQTAETTKAATPKKTGFFSAFKN